MAHRSEADVVVVGAGPAGLSLARALGPSGLHVTVVEAQELDAIAEPVEDGRDIALTHRSQHLMEELGLWDHIPESRVGTIRDARVLNGASHFALHFDAQPSGADYLGRIVPNHLIRKAVFSAAASCDNVHLLTGQAVAGLKRHEGSAEVKLTNGQSLSARLVVAADSRFSQVRRMAGIAADSLDFARVVIVCEMEHERPHNETAYECFQYDQTLAILPMPGNRCSAVVTMPAGRAAQAMEASEEAFAADVARRFEQRLGRMRLISPRHAYPLVAVLARKFVGPRFALVGDAAVGMHPVTAHGFNLGLSSAALLSQGISEAAARGRPISGMRMLRAYEAVHRRHAVPLFHGTNALVKLFTDSMPPARLARAAALRLGQLLPPVRRSIVKQLIQA